MHLNIRGRKVPISAALHEHCVNRLERALHPFREHVQSAELVLTDLNGPRGGLGQGCSVFVSLAGGTKLIVQSIESDFYTASGEATVRVGHLVGRSLAKIRTRTRSSSKHDQAESSAAAFLRS